MGTEGTVAYRGRGWGCWGLGQRAHGIAHQAGSGECTATVDSVSRSSQLLETLSGAVSGPADIISALEFGNALSSLGALGSRQDFSHKNSNACPLSNSHHVPMPTSLRNAHNPSCAGHSGDPVLPGGGFNDLEGQDLFLALS